MQDAIEKLYFKYTDLKFEFQLSYLNKYIKQHTSFLIFCFVMFELAFLILIFNPSFDLPSNILIPF